MTEKREKESKKEQPSKLKMLGMLGGAIIVMILLGGVIRLAIRKNSILFLLIYGILSILLLIGFIARICEMWSDYRLSKKNFEIYRVKRWVEKCLREIREGKIPETEYRFKGEKQGDYICIETVKVQWEDLEQHHFTNDHTPGHETNAWKVVSLKNGEKTVHGILRRKEWAYAYLFYLAAKKYADIDIEKWHWGFDAF